MGYFVKLFTKLSNDIFEWKFVRGLSYKLGDLQIASDYMWAGFYVIYYDRYFFFNATDNHFGDF